ncbi:MAG: hypothetical protein Q7K26_01210 [bacterium]|nr:hypothetical protein [bacterium]
MNQNILKGLLIILVIFDHNEYAHRMFPYFLQGFSFHVVGFFALPFLRPADPITKKTLGKFFFSYYVPFFWMVCCLATITMQIKQNFSSVDFQNLLIALYSGNSTILKKVTQMSLLWFLPSFLSLMLLRGLIKEINATAIKIVLGIFVVLHFFIGSISSELRNYLPLGLLPTLYVIPLIILIVELHQRIFEKIQRFQAAILTISAFLIVKYFQISMNLSQELGFAEVADYKNIPALIVNDLEAITGVLLLFQLARFNLGSLIEKCGMNSLQVYLLHAFVALVIFKSLEKFPYIMLDLRLALSLILTIIVSSLIAKSAMNNSSIKRYLFPKNWIEFTNPKKNPN